MPNITTVTANNSGNIYTKHFYFIGCNEKKKNMCVIIYTVCMLRRYVDTWILHFQVLHAQCYTMEMQPLTLCANKVSSIKLLHVCAAIDRCTCVCVCVYMHIAHCTNAHEIIITIAITVVNMAKSR